MRRLARGYEADPERRRDLLQEIHIELWRSLKSFDGRCSLQTWVYRISHNVGASHVVRSRRLAARLVDLETTEAVQSPLDAEMQAIRRVATGKLLELIHRLKPLDGGPRRSETHEPCAQFLEREFEGKRRGFLAFRPGLLFIVPGVAASCWGGGPMARAKALGFAPSSWQFQLSIGPWPFLIIGAVLIIVWFAFGKAAEKALRDEQAFAAASKVE